MRKTFLLSVLLALVLHQSSFGQVRRIVLLEEATNASCAPCAQNNPNLQAFFSTHFGGVISVRYHASWPGVDPMYSLNPSEATTRIVSYYGISGVPNYLLDGTNYGVPGDPEGIASLLRARLAMTSPVKISITTNITADSVRANVAVIGVGPVTQTGLTLQASVVERLVVYATPPGTNGERQFEDVMRKMLPNASGTAISSINVGDTLRYSFAVAVNPAWRWQDLAVVAWLQSSTTREVIQANISYPTYVVTTPDTPADFLALNQTYTKHYSIRNENPTMLHMRIAPQTLQLTSGWSYSMLSGGTPRDSVIANLAPNDSVSFDLRLTTGSARGSATIRLKGTNLDDPYGYAYSMEYFGVVARGNVLFVDDDGGATWENNYFDAFDSAAVQYTSIPSAYLSSIAGQITPAVYRAMFWNVSWDFPAFIPSDITFLTNYLDNGGRLYVAGQDIGWDIFDPSGGSRFTAAQNFYHTYLGANYVADNSGGTSMQGIPGDVISDGISFSLLSPYGSGNNYPESISPYPGTSGTNILRYNNNTYGGIRNQTASYKTVYLGIGLEQMSTPQARRQIIRRMLDWFGVTTDVQADGSGLPTAYALEQNFPNPFNPTTELTYSIMKPGDVTLKVYDLLGREVAALVRGFKPAGTYSVSFDASSLSSGVYFYTIASGEFTAVKKMLLLR